MANAATPLHTFDADASPHAKADVPRAAGEERLRFAEGSSEREVPVDSGGGQKDVPTIQIHDFDAGAPEPPTPLDDSPPSVVPTSPAEPLSPQEQLIPDWYTVGWRQMAEKAEAVSVLRLEGEDKDKAILEAFVSEQFYGTWMSNSPLILFAILTSHFLTRLGFGWGWLVILVSICATSYSTSMNRLRRNARDDIQRELVKTRLASEPESVRWMNFFLDRFWLIYEPVLSSMIVSAVDYVLSANAPSFVNSLRLSQFTLGTKAPKIDRIKTFPDSPENVVTMDWDVSFAPNDVAEMTSRQVANKVNPKVVLAVRVGRGPAGAVIPILVEDITLSGRMRVQFRFMSVYPHIELVDLCFLEKPVIDYVLKPLGGETFGVDIANLPGLSSFIREMTHATIGPMMYYPNVFTLNMEQLLSGTPWDASCGVLQITVRSARGIQAAKIAGGMPDPFVSLCFAGRPEVARTKYKHNTHNPTWSETKFILVNSLNDTLVLNVFDFNDFTKDTSLGAATFDLSILEEDASQDNIRSPIIRDGKERGELRYDISYYPVLQAEKGVELPETNVGIVRLTVHQGKELDASCAMSGYLSPFAKVFVGDPKGRPIHTTKTINHTNNPAWESTHEFLCADRKTSVVTIKVLDNRDFHKNPVVGFLSITLDDLLRAKKQEGRDLFPLSNCKSGKLRVSVTWKPLDLAGSLHGAQHYTPPIGVVRLWLKKATDVKNVEAALGGKSDPYVRVQIHNETKGRTEVIDNDLNPVWDQIIYIPVHSVKDILLLECMDYQHITRDRSLGSVELHVSDIATPSDNPIYPFESTGPKEVVDPLRLDKGDVYKGELHYAAEFLPAMKLKSLNLQDSANELQEVAVPAGSSDEDGGNTNGDDAGSVSSVSDDDGQFVPSGVTFQLSKQVTPSTEADGSPDANGASATSPTTTPVDMATAKEPAEEGVEMSTEELLSSQSGIIIFEVLSGELPKKARLEVLTDDAYWPSFSTSRARSKHARWDYVGEGFVKELDFGKVWLRLNDGEDGAKDDIIAQWRGDTKGFLQACMTGEQRFTLSNKDDKPSAVVSLIARYVPVPVKLDPRESVNNQGILQVDLLDGRDLPGVDRDGTSDPFAVFSQKDQKVFKSQTQKNTLNPRWNEAFAVEVRSRIGADFNVEVFDWDRIGQSESLGSASIDLASLEPFQAAEKDLSLTSSKHGVRGHVRVRLVFRPEILAKARKNTSSFSVAGRAMTQIGSLPGRAGTGVIQGVTGIFRRNKDDDETPEEFSANGEASASVNSDAAETALSLQNRDNVMVFVTVLDAKDLPAQDCKPYVSIRVGEKERKTKHVGKGSPPEWNKSFSFITDSSVSELYARIYDRKTFGKDQLLGEGVVDIWRHIRPDSPSSAEVIVELREGSGTVRLRLESSTDTSPSLSGRRSSVSSDTRSLVSVSRMNFSRRRSNDVR